MQYITILLLVIATCLSTLGEPQQFGRQPRPPPQLPAAANATAQGRFGPHQQFGGGYDGVGAGGYRGVGAGGYHGVGAGYNAIGAGGLGGAYGGAAGLIGNGFGAGGFRPGFGGGIPGAGVGSAGFSATFEQYIQYQVSFSYVHGFRAQYVPWIGFNRQVINHNALFYPKYGLFQARIPGIYFFSFAAVSDERDPFRIGLYRGYPHGTPIVHAYGDNQGYHATSQNAIVYLQRGDFCYLNLLQGHIYESHHVDRHYTSFTGTLLTPDWRQLSILGRPSIRGRSGQDDLPSLPKEIVGTALAAPTGFEIRKI